MKEKNASTDFTVLIPDGESHILVYVVNCLSQIKNVKIYVMSNKKNIAMRYSRFVHHFSYYKQTEIETEWISNIDEELKKHQEIDVVMPIFENGIRTIIKYQHLISQKHKLGILSSYENFNTAINKNLLSAFMHENNIVCPKSFVVEPGRLYEGNTVDFPAIAKPSENYGGGGKGIHVFDNKQDLNNFFSENNFSFPYLVQDYIKGYDIDCSVLCNNGHIVAYTIQKGTMLGLNKFSPQVGLEFLDEQNLYDVVEKLMKLLNWSGVAHVDMRFDEGDKIFKVVEINTRFWESTDASLIAGINFPYLYCLTSLHRPFSKPIFNKIKYLNLKGVTKSIKKDLRFLLNYKFILNNTQFKFVKNDPIPYIYKFISRTKNIIFKKMKINFLNP